ncbi:N-acetylneuraminate synthase family protein [Candidatus Altiarchaeota archaeon]
MAITGFFNKSTYLIAECAYSFEGEKTYLLDSIKALSDTRGVDAVKFHILCDMDSYATSDHNVYDLLKDWMLRQDEWVEVIDKTRDSGLDAIILADDLASMDFLKGIEEKLAAIEIHAVSLNDVTMLEKASSFKIPVILGIGGSTIDEIEYAVNYLREDGKEDIVLMYGFQNYPTKYEYVNLKKMGKIKDKFNLPLGYADHTSWDDANQEMITLAGFMAGASIIEKHFVLEKGVKRTDYEAAVSTEDLSILREKMTILSKAMGSGDLGLNPYEMEYGATGPMKKVIVAAKDIRKGEPIMLENIAFKRTGRESPVKQMQVRELLDRKAGKKIIKDDLITFDNTLDPGE